MTPTHYDKGFIMPTDKEVAKPTQRPELTLDLIEKGKAKEIFDANIREASRQLVAFVNKAGQKVSKARATITMKVKLGYDKGQYTVVAEQKKETPAPLPQFDFLALTETTGGTPTLTRGDYPGQDQDAPGQQLIGDNE